MQGNHNAFVGQSRGTKIDCVNEIPCNSYNQTYIRETGETCGTRLEEHKKVVETNATTQFTREQNRKSST